MGGWVGNTDSKPATGKPRRWRQRPGEQGPRTVPHRMDYGGTASRTTKTLGDAASGDATPGNQHGHSPRRNIEEGTASDELARGSGRKKALKGRTRRVSAICKRWQGELRIKPLRA